MKTALLLVVALVMTTGTSLAIPVCADGVPYSVATLGVAGCTYGATTFSNFAISGGAVIGGASANAVDANLLAVTITYAAPFFSVTLTPN
ncbi:MAG: hypothetical protein ACRD96_08325, partial [Bryobacteraceae bacterium]